MSEDPLRIVFQDEYLLAVSKPSGLAVHSTKPEEPSLEKVVADVFGKGLVLYHRLDKDTSGLVLLGKRSSRSREVHQAMTLAFEKKLIRKAYLAIVRGEWRKEWNKVESFVGRAESGLMRNFDSPEKDAKGAVAKKALTTFRVILTSERDPKATWIEAMPKTGRTHQIRLHCLFHGCPILGDPFYGAGDGLPLALHAYRVDFKHPISGESIRLIEPPPEAWRSERLTAFASSKVDEAYRRLFESKSSSS